MMGEAQPFGFLRNRKLSAFPDLLVLPVMRMFPFGKRAGKISDPIPDETGILEQGKIVVANVTASKLGFNRS